VTKRLNGREHAETFDDESERLGGNTIMKTIALASILFVACSAPSTNDPQPAPTAPPVISATQLAVEQAIRDIDVNKSLPAAREKLEAALKDASLPANTRDEATLALARALDALNEKEQGIKLMEDLLKKHVDDHPWAHEEQADEILQKLVTGKVSHAPREDEPITIAPIARALTSYFPVKDGKVFVRTYAFGGNRSVTDRLGTFAITDAIREMRKEACPLCDDKLSAHTSSSRSDSWTRIPAEGSRVDDALVVVYFDLVARRIPARYDALLPMPSADIVARLEKGEGLIAVKTRDAAPPVILLAAPRDALLGDVEEAFAQMKALPTAPVTVSVSPRLRPREIQHTIRGARASFKTCADALLGKTPDAAGKIVLKLKVHADGTTSDVHVEPSATKLDDASFVQCVEKAVATLSFPKGGSDTNVTYPIAISPG
jgi:hypothetical protein